MGKIWCWNVNGVRSVLKGGSLVKFLNEVKPDILCLNETKIDGEALVKEGVKGKLSEWFPPSLQFWNCCKVKKGYSGTAILVSKDFVGGVPTKVEYDFGAEGLHDQEGRTVTCYFKDFILVASYVPNSGVVGLQRLDYRVNQWDRDFQHFLKEELEVGENKPVVLCGDLNVAHKPIDIYDKTKTKQAGFTPQERNSFDAFLTASGFIDTYRL